MASTSRRSASSGFSHNHIVAFVEGIRVTKIIKRYANRKLYDTQKSTYITLDEVQSMVKAGQDIRIIDNKSKEDLTSATLAQIIFEQEKSHKKLLSLPALRYIIQSGEDFVQKLQSPVNQFRDDIKRKADEQIEGSGRAVRDFIDSTQRSLDVMQRKIDDRLRDSVDQMTHIPEMQMQMQMLEARLIALEASVRRIENVQRDKGAQRSATSRDPYSNLP